MGQVAHSAKNKYLPKSKYLGLQRIYIIATELEDVLGIYFAINIKNLRSILQMPSERPAPTDHNTNNSECYSMAGGGAKG